MARSSYRPPKIPEMTIRRLSVYTRCLLQLEEDGIKTISSQELAERFNLNSAQVRKDLAYFGEFGVRGIGYYVSGLKAELQRLKQAVKDDDQFANEQPPNGVDGQPAKLRGK